MWVTVEIPDTMNYAGRTYIPTGEYRIPKASEYVLEEGHIINVVSNDWRCKHHIYKLITPFVFPSWVPKGWWYAEDEDGESYLYTSRKPAIHDSCCWSSSNHGYIRVEPCMGFTPIGGNWKKTLRQNA